MFYSKRIHYILTILEIGFIVVTRKLILLDPKDENSSLIFVLSLAAIGFFLLIFYFYRVVPLLHEVEELPNYLPCQHLLCFEKSCKTGRLRIPKGE